jgi:opacity protein-like surface antigen
VLLAAKTDLKGIDLGAQSLRHGERYQRHAGLLRRHQRVGATAGLGVEYGLTPNISAKIEYRYIAAASLELSHINEFLAGANYRFGGP